MGVNYESARLLIHARSMGISFGRTLTLGRQNLFATAWDLVDMLKASGDNVTLAEVEAFKRASDGYCEGFFKHLGATVVESMDAADYEGATHIHDLNEPFPVEWHQCYDTVYDGGTLEHVFNFPTAIRNSMEALALGGHFICKTPVNNQMGHGFFQFSPELYYQVFSPQNGFEVRFLALSENYPPYDWHVAANPSDVRDRVLLTNFRETHMVVIARRTAIVPIFAQTPQQSDYQAAWGSGSKCDSGLGDLGSQTSLSRRLLPAPIKAMLRPLVMLARDAPRLRTNRRFPAPFYRRHTRPK